MKYFVLIIIFYNSISSLFSQNVPYKYISTNIFSLVRYSTDVNLNFGWEFQKNNYSIGIDVPILEKRGLAKQSFDIWRLDKSKMNYKIDFNYSRYFNKNKRYFFSASLKYHNMNYEISELGKCVSFSSSGELFGNQCTEGYKNIYYLKLQKVVPSIGVGVFHHFNDQFFLSSDFRVGYSFIINDNLEFKNLENEITVVPKSTDFKIDEGFFDDLINHGGYVIDEGKKQTIAVQINLIFGYKF